MRLPRLSVSRMRIGTARLGILAIPLIVLVGMAFTPHGKDHITIRVLWSLFLPAKLAVVVVWVAAFILRSKAEIEVHEPEER